VRARIVVFIAIVQSILFLGHFAVYRTWIDLWGVPRAPVLLALRETFSLLSVSFIAASLVAFRFSNLFARIFYRIAATWLGFLNFFLCSAFLSAVVSGLTRLTGWRTSGRLVVAILFGLAAVVSIYGIFNAGRIRIKRVNVKLPNLPQAWRGRTAALVSDLHLGHVRGYGFSSRIVALLAKLCPHIIFIAGDFYDGTRVDANRVAEPWSKLATPFGVYFVAGNHEEFSDHTKYLEAMKRAGVRVLNNEKVLADGIEIVGVHYHASVNPRRFESILRNANLDRNRASILVSHAPHRLPIPERAGISLQLSGHTHRGQLIPARWIVERIFGPYAYGLHAFGNMMVCTSSGVGTWGPPLRVGTNSEIVLIRFEPLES
jgi:uncharacterized protein